MSVKRRQFSSDFKIAVVQQLEAGVSAAQLAREHGIHPNLPIKWRDAYRRNPANAFPGNGNAASTEATIAQLERTVGQLYTENAFLKKTLNWLREQEASERSGRG